MRGYEGCNLLFRLGVKEDPSEFYNYREQLELLGRGLRDPATRMIVVKGCEEDREVVAYTCRPPPVRREALRSVRC